MTLNGFTREDAERHAAKLKELVPNTTPEHLSAGILKASMVTLLGLNEEQAATFQAMYMKDLLILGRHQIDMLRAFGFLKEGL